MTILFDAWIKGIRVNININSEGKKLTHSWSMCVGAGRAGEGLRSEWRDQLREIIKECGFRYIRFHGLLADDMFPVKIVNDKVQYNWCYIDNVYDFLIENGIRPIVELGFMPTAFATGTNACFWWKGNVTPPKDFDLWKQLIFELTTHFVERYGLEEVQKWYFEVWNEPNLKGFWAGTKSEYFYMYEVSVQAVKSVHESLKVGGPATSNYVPDDRFVGEKEDVHKQKTHFVEDINTLEWRGVWIEDFLTYCEEKSLLVDFISTHPYPTDFALDGQQVNKGKSRKVDAVHDDISWLLKVVGNSCYKNAEIHLTEWSSSPLSRDYTHDSLLAASYIIKTNLRCGEMIDSLSYWVFTDVFEEGGGGPEPFHGGFGMISMHGIKKPSYHAYKMLNQLGEIELTRDDNSIVTKDASDKITGLFYHYPPEMTQTIPIVAYGDIASMDEVMNLGNPITIDLCLENLDINAQFCLEVLNDKNTPLTVWRKMGMPHNLTRDQERILKALTTDKYSYCADETGKLDISITLNPWEVAFLKQII